MKSYNEVYALSDTALVEELGLGIKRMRLNQNYSQQELADRSGVDRITISKLENGRPPTMLTLVQVLRGLQRLDVLFSIINEPSFVEGMFNDVEGDYRKRASHPRKTKTKNDSTEW